MPHYLMLVHKTLDSDTGEVVSEERGMLDGNATPDGASTLAVDAVLRSV